MTSRVQMLVEPDGFSPEIISVHMNIDIESPYSAPFLRPLRESGPAWEALPERGRQIMTRLFQIDGVTSVGISSYEIRVTRARMFPNEIILGEVTQAMKDVFGDELDITGS